MKKRVHLAVVSPYPPATSGISLYGYHVSTALARTEVFERITVLTEPGPDQLQVEPHERIRIEPLRRWDSLDVGRQIGARLAALKPDLVWYNFGASTFGRSPLANLSGFLSPVLSRLVDLPGVVTVHEMVEQADLQALRAAGGQFAGAGARLIRFLTTRSDVICVTLRRHEQWLAAHDPTARLVHIPLGVYDRPEILPESGGRELLVFGNFAPFKGLELLLEVFRDLHRRDPATRLTIAGSDHHRFPGYLARVREAFGDHEGVRWLGPVPEPALRDLFARATIVTLPYRASTGSSSVLYRAAGWGRPVVASDLPELRATADEQNLEAEFFRCGDAAGLAAALERLFGDPDLRASRARHNLNAVRRTATLAHTSQAYLHAFDLALATRKSDIRIPGPLLQHSPEAL